MQRNPVYSSPNKLKLGLFQTNIPPAHTTLPELFHPTWDNSVRLAMMADDMGLEAIVAIARWKGFLDDHFDHPKNEILEPFTYAAGLAQATKQIGIFATTHAPTVHPMQLAKQAATIDHISGGRFSLNVVGGWNRREFEMFGIDLLEHDKRYDYLEEWLSIVRKLWSADREFDVNSENFRIKGAVSRPQPLQRLGIPIMNAGLSPRGNRFAAEYADIGFIALYDNDPIRRAEQIGTFKRLAEEEFGRSIQVWTSAFVTIRDTDTEALEYEHRFSVEYLDRVALDGQLATMMKETPMPVGSPRYEMARRLLATGQGMPITGSPETVCSQLSALSAAGVDGVVISSVDFLDSVDRLGKFVLPLLEEAGLRVPFSNNVQQSEAPGTAGSVAG